MTLTKNQKEKVLLDYQEKIDSGELIQLDTGSASELRKSIWESQRKKCPILNQEIDFKDSTLDHKHRKADDIYGGEDGLGLVRGVLHRQSNSFEGKVYNLFIRLGISKFIGFPEVLENLAKYIRENPPKKYIYPSEAPKVKRQKLYKRDYQKVIKHYKDVYPKRKKLPEKSVYLTKKWEKMIQDTNKYLQKQQKLKSKRGKG